MFAQYNISIDNLESIDYISHKINDGFNKVKHIMKLLN